MFFFCFYLHFVLNKFINRKQKIYDHLTCLPKKRDLRSCHMIMLLFTYPWLSFFFLSRLSLTLFHPYHDNDPVIFWSNSLFVTWMYKISSTWDSWNKTMMIVVSWRPIKDLSNLCFSLSDLKSKSQKKLKSKSLLMWLHKVKTYSLYI